MSIRLVCGVLVAMSGLALVWWAAADMWANLRFRRTARRVPGRVVRHVAVASDGEGDPVHALDVEFTYEGRQRVIRTSWGTARPRAVGRPIGVLVPGGAPEDARVDSVFELWAMPVLWATFGVCAGAIGAVLIASAE